MDILNIYFFQRVLSTHHSLHLQISLMYEYTKQRAYRSTATPAKDSKHPNHKIFLNISPFRTVENRFARTDEKAKLLNSSHFIRNSDANVTAAHDSFMIDASMQSNNKEGKEEP